LNGTPLVDPLEKSKQGLLPKCYFCDRVNITGMQVRCECCWRPGHTFCVHYCHSCDSLYCLRCLPLHPCRADDEAQGHGSLEDSLMNLWGALEHKELRVYLTNLCLYGQLKTNTVDCAETRLRRFACGLSEKVGEQQYRVWAGGRMPPEEQTSDGARARTDAALMVAPSLVVHARVAAEKNASLAKNLRNDRVGHEAGEKK
jgi:hypothetical protein